MEDSTQIDFPTVPNPPFPPWSLQGPISRDEPSTPVGVSRSPLPSIGFPVDRAKNTPWEFEFSSNRPLSPVELKPLTIKQGTAENKFQVIPGYVNMEMPTLATVALDNDPPPEITASTTDTYVWIKVVGTFGVSSDTYVVTIETTTTSSPPSGTAISSTGFTSFRSIGVVYYTAASGGDPESWDIVNFHNGGNLAVESFGNVNLWWLA